MVVSNEEKIAHQALQKLHAQTGLRFDLLDTNNVLGTGLWPDMRLRIADTAIELIGEIKNQMLGDDVLPTVKQLRAAADGRTPMLIAGHIDSAAGQALKALDVNYLDASGNAYINLPPFFVFIDGRNDVEKAARRRVTRRYSHGDLQVIFALLSNPSLLNANYGDIASYSNVALGVCGAVFRDLKDQGYFVESVATKTREWRCRYKLLGQWVAQYPLLRSKHYIGTYRPASLEWWRAEAFAKYGAQLGGRFAVASYTDSQSDYASEIYLDEHQQWQFVREMQFQECESSANDESVVVRSKYWGDADNDGSRMTIHPLISYADLIDAGDEKSLKSANEILSKHLV